MPDYKVTFVGDLGNLRQFDAAIRNSAIETSRQIEAAHTRIASSVGKVAGTLKPDSGAGLFTTRQKTQVDSYNRTLIHTGQIIRQTIKDYEILRDKQNNFSLKPIIDQTYIGDYREVIGNLDAIEKANKKIAKSEAQILQIRKQARTQQMGFAQEIVGLQAAKGAVTKQLAEMVTLAEGSSGLGSKRAQLAKIEAGDAFAIDGGVATREEIERRIQELRNKYTGVAGAGTTAIPPGEREATNAEIDRLERTLRTPQGTALAPLVSQLKSEMAELEKVVAVAAEPFLNDIKAIQAAITQLEAKSKQAASRAASQERAVRKKNPAYAELDAANKALPPIQKDLATVLNQSKELRSNLLRSGLGGGAKFGTDEFLANLAKQEAGVNKFTENIRTNTKTIQGSFRDLKTGLLKDFTVDLDQNGKVIGRWGGQLRGAGTFLKQTVRDFQKVIEWTVATTLVFGALATVVTQLQGINELNTSLARFSITAQLTSEETAGLFKNLSDIAYSTATPLKDLVKVADDIALATREANQSTGEWHQSILALTQAVGIFTNLTGKDTVQSADLLSAAFKQLDIAPDQLVGVLNKVTAVAGGQATAIADILQSIGGLAEAAKAAGFSIDEQIASVQVLSQVTNKTSDEVATAFKNLFGSVSSVGSVKILDQFNIDVRDAEGGVRDFLDIYRDVKTALDTGIIPQNRLPDVLRGISGGPRRAPDAAALLANLDRIDEVIGKSVGATNEALIANAKILDTNQAKIVQFQNAFDTAVYERFGQAVSDLTEILTSFGTEFLGVFNQIPSNILSTVVTLGLLAGGMRLVGGALKTVLVPGFKGLKTSLAEAVTNMRSLIDVNRKYNFVQGAQGIRLGKGSQPIQARGKTYKPGALVPFDIAQQYSSGFNVPFSSQFSKLPRGAKVGLGVAALGGAAVGSAALGKGLREGIDARQIGSILQAGGALATLIPSGIGQAAGVAAIAVGTALQFIAGESEKAKKSANELSIEIYDLTQALQASQGEANAYATTQKRLGVEIEKINAKQEKTANDQIRLNGLAADYAEATLGLAVANSQVSQSFDDLLKKLPEVSERYQALLRGVRDGGIKDTGALKDLSQRLAADILRQTGQIIYSGNPIPLSSNFRENFGTETRAVTTAEFRRAGGQAETFDLSRLVDNPQELLKLFNLDTGQANFQIPQNDLTLGYLQSALQQLPALQESGELEITNEQLARLTEAITAMTVEVSSAAANLAAASQLRATGQSNAAIGLFSAEQAGNASVAAKLIEEITKAQQAIPRSQGFSPDLQDNTSQLAQRLQEQAASLQASGIQGLAPSNRAIVEMAENVFKASGYFNQLQAAGDEALNAGIYQWAETAGFSIEQLSSLAQYLNYDLSQIPATLEEINIRTEEAKANAAKAFADRSLNLLIAENSGQYEDNAKGLAILKEQNLQAYESSIQLSESINQLSATSFVDLAKALSNVTGLQYLQFLSADELTEAQGDLGNQLIENAVKAGVNAEGIQKINNKLVQLFALTEALRYKKIVIEIEQVYTTRGTREGGFSLSPALQNQATKAIEEVNKVSGADPTKAINKILDQINKIMAGGSGSNLGALPKSAAAKAAAPYNKPGLLDVPDEILEEDNYRQLLAEAIQKARDLQAVIPGESKENRKDIVELLNGTQRILETRGVGEEYLRRALDELTDEIKRQNDLLSKADTIRRIRVGSGTFNAIANVPLNSQSGVSVGGANGPIDISLNLNGTVLTPAQFAQFADLVAASIKRQIAS